MLVLLFGISAFSQQLVDGDLVFHRSQSSQATAIAAATGSEYTHVGVVFHERGSPMVFEAVEPVKMTPYAEWVRRGKDGHVVVKRLQSGLSDEVLAEMATIREKWLGLHYDVMFQWSDDKLYCSELAWKLYDRAAGIQLGELKPLGEFELADPAVQALLLKRTGGAIPKDQRLISPAEMMADPRLVEVSSQP